MWILALAFDKLSCQYNCATKSKSYLAQLALNKYVNIIAALNLNPRTYSGGGGEGEGGGCHAH